MPLVVNQSNVSLVGAAVKRFAGVIAACRCETTRQRVVKSFPAPHWRVSFGEAEKEAVQECPCPFLSCSVAMSIYMSVDFFYRL